MARKNKRVATEVEERRYVMKCFLVEDKEHGVEYEVLNIDFTNQTVTYYDPSYAIITGNSSGDNLFVTVPLVTATLRFEYGID